MDANARVPPRLRNASNIRASISYSHRPPPDAMNWRATLWPSATTGVLYGAGALNLTVAGYQSVADEASLAGLITGNRGLQGLPVATMPGMPAQPLLAPLNAGTHL